MSKALIYTVGFVMILAVFALAQDPGIRDSLIIGSVDLEYAPGESLIVDIPIYFVTDDSISSVMVPIVWNSPDNNIEVISSDWSGIFDSWESTYSNDDNNWFVGFNDLGGTEEQYLFTNSDRHLGLTLRFRIDNDASEQYISLSIGNGPYNLPLNFGVTTGDMDQDLTPVVVPGYIRYGAVGIDDEPTALPNEYALSQNYPNPFNPETNIEFQIPHSSYVSIEIFNLLGQNVRTLISEQKQAGFYTARWNGRNDGGQIVPSGIYFYRIAADGFSKTKKMIMLK